MASVEFFFFKSDDKFYFLIKKCLEKVFIVKFSYLLI